MEATLFVVGAARMSGIKTPSLPGVRAISSTWLMIEKRPADDALGGLSTEHLWLSVQIVNTGYRIILLLKLWIRLRERRLKAVCKLVEDVRDLRRVRMII